MLMSDIRRVYVALINNHWLIQKQGGDLVIVYRDRKFPRLMCPESSDGKRLLDFILKNHIEVLNESHI
jgi:hypothetical protein